MTKDNLFATSAMESEGYWKYRCEELFKQLETMKKINAAAVHDLKHPIAAIMLATDLIKTSQSLKDALDLADTISRASKGALNLIDRLLDFAHAEYAAKLPKEEVNLQTLLMEICSDFRVVLQQSEGAVKISANIPGIKGHRLQLQQLFQNLIANALKYRSEKPPIISITATEGAEQWYFEVQDNGIGINFEKQKSLFEPFHRLDSIHEGTGIGLAICRSVVEQHGGQMGVRSLPGQGSCFHFTLSKT